MTELCDVYNDSRVKTIRMYDHLYFNKTAVWLFVMLSITGAMTFGPCYTSVYEEESCQTFDKQHNAVNIDRLYLVKLLKQTEALVVLWGFSLFII